VAAVELRTRLALVLQVVQAVALQQMMELLVVQETLLL
jgi:hypothetical protein